MKKIISILLVCFLMLGLVACVEDEPNQDPTPAPEKEKVHLMVLAGQSGARGKALVNDLSEEDKELNVDVDILADGLPMGELGDIPGIDDSLYIDVLEPGYGDFPSEFGPEIGMGQTMASAYPKFDAEYKSVIVKYTASGSTFTDHWYSSSAINDTEVAAHLNLNQVNETSKGEQTGPLTNNLYQLVEKAIAELTDLGYDVVIDGMAFVHGEQDAKFDDNMAIYEKALTYFINDFRSYFNDADMPVVVTEALTNSAKYSNQLRAIQKYKDLGYVFDSASADKKFALSVVKGGAELAKIYGDEYYMNVLEYPRISEDDVCSSMFGVSAYSVNAARAMEIITAINTRPALRNILQYGVEDVHYQIDENGNLSRLNQNYMMDIEKTGNMFIAYPEEGVDADIWNYGKTQNFSALSSLTLGFGIKDPADINNEGPLAPPEGSAPPTTDGGGNIIEEVDTRFAAYLLPQVEAISAEVEAALKAVKSSEELEALIAKYTVECQKIEGVTTHSSTSEPTSMYYYYLSWLLDSGLNEEIVLE